MSSFLSGFEHVTPIHTRPYLLPRASWTSAALGESAIENEFALSLRRANEALSDLFSGVLGQSDFTDLGVERITDAFLNSTTVSQDYRQKILDAVQNLIVQEIINQAAEELARDLAGITEDGALMLEHAYDDVKARAELEGLPLPSELPHLHPPVYPPVPPEWMSRTGDKSPEAWFNLRLDLVNPYAVDYAERAAIRLSGVLDQNILDSVRATIATGYNSGWTVEEMAAMISQKVGLFPRWSSAVDRYFNGLKAKGVDDKFAQLQAARYAYRLRQKRALMIARTETMRASNYGRLSAWNAMADIGLLDLRGAKKQWLTAPIETGGSGKTNKVTGPCDICEPMNGVQVAFDGEFDVPDMGSVDAPPAHPNCRCTVLFISAPPPSWEDMGGEVQWLQDPGPDWTVDKLIEDARNQ